MPWPFTSAVAPTFDTGPGTAVPVTPTLLTAGAATPLWILGMKFKNTGVVDVTVTVTDGAGKIVYQETLSPNAKDFEGPSFEPVLGLIWGASGSGVLGHIWGYV